MRPQTTYKNGLNDGNTEDSHGGIQMVLPLEYFIIKLNIGS